MRRTAMITFVAGVIALAPAAALARGHHRGHHQRGRHGRVHTERFGPVSSGAPSANPSDNAGTVASFAGGVLTLRLTDGSTVGGVVNDGTEIKCEAPAATAQMADHGGDGESGDNGSGDGGTSGDQTAAQQTSPGTQPAEPNDGAAENEAAEPNDNEANDNEANDNEANDNDAAENENEGQQAGSCGSSSLVAGAVVREAELRVSSTGAVFKDVELVK